MQGDLSYQLLLILRNMIFIISVASNIEKPESDLGVGLIGFELIKYVEMCYMPRNTTSFVDFLLCTTYLFAFFHQLLTTTLGIT